MRFRVVPPAFALLLLTGCAADVTFFIDVHRNGSALVTTREVIDDQLYLLAQRQNMTGDPFGIERLESEGWSVSATSDDRGNHVITMWKLLSRGDLNSAGSGHPAPAL